MMAVVLLLAVCPAAYISCFESFFVQFDFCLFSVVDGFFRHFLKHAVLGIVLIGFYVTSLIEILLGDLNGSMVFVNSFHDWQIFLVKGNRGLSPSPTSTDVIGTIYKNIAAIFWRIASLR